MAPLLQPHYLQKIAAATRTFQWAAESIPLRRQAFYGRKNIYCLSNPHPGRVGILFAVFS
ncbi:hypothetical protein CLOSTMETH_00384 [[Clostridium] methylpentosum DSM 5476]|uniref:Uncharacterized protein n=1 Tax=[Clostridium] methylpentosum DSM 5476 TaxID=537013 RepID=C0E986_9FIRM|nr:hypothetical protein CLOSTMETH_00384 [[Clostridium] methylpentosum DSM 5476]